MKKLKVLSLLIVSVIIGCTSDNSDNKNDEVDESLPVITTKSVSLITDNSAQSGGEITKEGTSQVISKGICWSINQNPTIDDENATATGSSNSFVSVLNNLKPETTYFTRSYATNTTGIAYGNQVKFVTDVVKVNAPCLPTANTMNYNGRKLYFGSSFAGEKHATFGNYGVIAGGVDGDLDFDFSHAPESGVFTIVSSFSLNTTLNECKISVIIDEGVLNSRCTSGPSVGDSIYVTKLGKDSYSITFCNIEFSCLNGNFYYNFTTSGNITD